MPKRQNPQYKRDARFDRPAFRADMDRLTYARIPKSVCHPWAKPILDDLSPAANKVLSLLVSLAMVGRRGYPGLAECDAYACKVVEKITDQKCGLSTWRNGRRELCEKGLASRTYWTRPDQRIRNGKRVVVVPGGERVHLRGDDWCTKQIRITLLTPAGAGLFDRATRLESDDILSLLPTALKSDARSLIEDSRKSLSGFPASLKQTTNNNVGSELSDKSVLNNEHTTCQDSAPGTSRDEKEGKETRPAGPTSSNRAAVEQRHDERKELSNSESNPAQNDRGANKTKEKRYDESAWFSGPRGCNAKRPTLPKGNGRRKGKSYSRIRLLNILHRCLENYPTQIANEIYSRSKVELELEAYTNWPSVINLRYWISRSPHLTRRELFGYMRSRIIPALRFSGPVTPEEPKRYHEWTEKKQTVVEKTVPVGHMAGFLQNFSKTVGLE